MCFNNVALYLLSSRVWNLFTLIYPERAKEHDSIKRRLS